MEFTVNPTRFDPYKTFKFRIKWDGAYIAGVLEDQRAQVAPRSVIASLLLLTANFGKEGRSGRS